MNVLNLEEVTIKHNGQPDGSDSTRTTFVGLGARLFHHRRAPTYTFVLNHISSTLSKSKVLLNCSNVCQGSRDEYNRITLNEGDNLILIHQRSTELDNVIHQARGSRKGFAVRVAKPRFEVTSVRAGTCRRKNL